MHDFPDPDVSKAVPYGIYDICDNEGWVNVGMSTTLRSLRSEHLDVVAPDGKASLSQVYATFDLRRCRWQQRLPFWNCGSVNCKTLRRSRVSQSRSVTFLQEPASGTRSSIACFQLHYSNWRGRPLTDYRTIVNLIAGTTTKAGLTVKVLLDRRTYKRGIKVSKKEMQALNLKSHDFHGEWNYTIASKQRSA